MTFLEKQELLSLVKTLIPEGDYAELLFPDDSSPLIINPENMVKDRMPKIIRKRRKGK